MKCNNCGSTRVRVSRLKISDLAQLLSFNYPLRCHSCFDRVYVRIPVAWQLHQAERLRRQQWRAKRKESSTADKL